ncbi:MAG: hypothetical protein ONB44_10050 [candidate division KSB1 bacterium]|nr:hypothetical protein [candidate division KSB1 bacterium]MDZ7302466.1 hypothetical protein [candidate division KSB1 bacterium]MDZ7311938.1 hypothetical protein [candidate division KSB1 bacterium]
MLAENMAIQVEADVANAYNTASKDDQKKDSNAAALVATRTEEIT